MIEEQLIREINNLKDKIDELEKKPQPRWKYLSTPLTSTSWDGGDDFSTTAKTLIDLSAVFSVPAGIKTVLARCAVRDSGSAAGNAYLILSPNNVAGSGIVWRCSGRANDQWEDHGEEVPCDSNGDVYYQILATGVNTLNALIEIWGYYL